MAEKINEWMPRDQWASLVNGENCPLCLENRAAEPVNEHGYTVAHLGFSRLRLALNQFVAGYCVLICNKHIQEPHHLPHEEQRLFFNDLMHAARAIERVFNPIKMNFQILGNLVPHLHVHILPRYHGDPSPGCAIDPGLQVITWPAQEYQEKVRLIQEALKVG